MFKSETRSRKSLFLCDGRVIDFYHMIALSRMSIVHNKSSTLSSRAQSHCQKLYYPR